MAAIAVLPDTIVVTASRAPEPAVATPASATVIDAKRIRRLGEPLVPALLRLLPSTAVAASGPAGSLTEVRIRGAEANHTLLFIDGIRANDPAAGNTPRFELLNADLASRIEQVRGPQSALWGPEAIGGVIAVEGNAADAAQLSATTEAGSFGFHRASLAASQRSDRTSLLGAIGWQGARGIDSFNGHGDRDGYNNISGRLRGTWQVAPSIELGASGFALGAHSAFDGLDALTFVRADTRDNSRNRLAAGRLWARVGALGGAWTGTMSSSLLRSSNHNFLGRDELNRTSGGRDTTTAEVEYRFALGPIASTIIAAAEHEHESFAARDTIYGGFSDQDRRRNHESLTLEWRGVSQWVTADVAARHDRFDRFEDATTVRASLLAPVGGGFSLAVSYGEGIAQPTFFDLYGFFPGSFVGNPSLRPERSRGFEGSLRYVRGAVSGSLTAYSQRLQSEIIDTFDPVTLLASTINLAARSRRQGVEAEIGWSIGDRIRLSANYAFLDATEPEANPSVRLREVRRPRHSGAIVVDGALGKFTYGTSLAYSGARTDSDFDQFPAVRVRLHPYLLAGARVAYAVRPGIELFARAANAFNAQYQDVVGYRTEGRGLYAGIRLADRD